MSLLILLDDVTLSKLSRLSFQRVYFVVSLISTMLHDILPILELANCHDLTLESKIAQ